VVIRIVVLLVVVIAACVVLSRVSVVGPSGLNPPKPAPEPRRPDRRVSSDADELVRSWRVLGPVAMVGAAGCALIAVSTFLPDPLVMPRVVVVSCFAGTIPLVMLSIATFAELKRTGRSVLSTMESAAPDAWPLAAVLLAAFLLIAFTGLGAPSGDPQARDGRYFLNNHGVLTEISREQHERYETLKRRTIAGSAGGLYTPGIALGLYSHGRSDASRRSAPGRGRRRHGRRP
jgi:hypothetical protein